MMRSTRLSGLAVALATLLSVPALAQSPAGSSKAESLFQRARELVAEGNGAAGRALVDSILGSEKEGTPSYAEALYWRASLADSVSSAQQDYLRLSIEYSTAPRAPEALLRLAQLELTRGNTDQAVRHLDRLVRDYPSSPVSAQGHYWHGRVLLDSKAAGREQAACASLEKAASISQPADAELRNQIAFYSQRCAPRAAVSGAPKAAAPTSPSPATPSDAGRTPPKSPEPATKDAPFAVQVAAYAREADAANMAARLRRRGLEARVVQGPGVHRVWIGRYGTRTEATAALQELKRIGIDGFVAEAK
jgi:tetratricopeptide (TPR) repeat protein